MCRDSAVARKLRMVILTALGVGAAAVAVLMLLGANLHFFTRRPALPPQPHPSSRSTPPPGHPHGAPGSSFHIPLTVLLYTLLLVLFLFLLNRKIQAGPEELEDVETADVASLPDTFREIFSRSRRAADLGDER